MPYNKRSELPDSVQNNLPAHAQDIYKEAYNSAEKQYSDPSKRKGNSSKEQTAHQVAWSAVKQQYEKDNQGNWKKKG